MTAATIINDAPVVVDDIDGDWRPGNSEGEFRGPTRLRVGLYRSRNLVTIRVLQDLGLANALDFLKRFGFAEGRLPTGLSLALGSASLTPLEMANAYAVLANGGFKVTPWYIQRITKVGEQRPIAEAVPRVACRECNEETESVTRGGKMYPVAERVVDPQALYILRDIMRDVIERGTGRGVRDLNRSDIVGKTGTTNDQRDAWFSGFNTELVATVWVGKDSNESTGEYGAQAALPIWESFMRHALKGTPERIPERPEGIITARIDPESGRRLHDDQSGGIEELFIEGTLPSYEPRPIDSEIENNSGSQGTGTYEAIF